MAFTKVAQAACLAVLSGAGGAIGNFSVSTLTISIEEEKPQVIILRDSEDPVSWLPSRPGGSDVDAARVRCDQGMPVRVPDGRCRRSN